MKTYSNPIRTTIVFGLICALVFFMQGFVFGYNTFLPVPAYVTAALFLIFYALLMTRWSRSGIAALIFPVAIVIAGFFLTQSPSAFLALTFLVFSWIRSGICFKGPFLKRILAEALLCGVAGLGFIFYSGDGWEIRPLGVWMFFLIQSLYFLIVTDTDASKTEEKVRDNFENARNEAERILSGVRP